MTSEQRIAEWAEQTLKDMRLSWIHNRTPLMNAARTLIASVRAEVIEECAKVCDAYDCQSPGGLIVANAIGLHIRALVKERKG